MRKNLAIAMFGCGLALVCVSQSLAGSMGNGAAQRRAAAGLPPQGAMTQYVFCYGGNPHAVYFSPVFTAASTRGPVGLSAAYGRYLTQMDYKADGGHCIHAYTSADASAAKVRSENEFRSGRAIIETSWSGN